MNIKLLGSLLIPLLCAYACASGPIVKAALDDEISRLCAIDGGVKVYEIVTLPADKFNKWVTPLPSRFKIDEESTPAFDPVGD